MAVWIHRNAGHAVRQLTQRDCWRTGRPPRSELPADGLGGSVVGGVRGPPALKEIHLLLDGVVQPGHLMRMSKSKIGEEFSCAIDQYDYTVGHSM